MKYLYYLLLTFSLSLSAQTISGDLSGIDSRLDSVGKELLSPTKVQVLYEYRRQLEKSDTFAVTVDPMLLFIGDGYSKFVNAYVFALDTLQDNAYKRGSRSFFDIMGDYSRLLKMPRFKESYLYNWAQNKLEVIQPVYQSDYSYTETIPQQEWTLANADSVILGYSCKLATTVFRGRSYRAWYAPEISLPYGPWKFSGLPGLILSVSDTDGEHRYTAQGIEEIREYQPIYKELGAKIIYNSRENIRKIAYRFAKDPASLLRNSGSIVFSGETLQKMKAKPYNPQELE